MRKVLIFHLNPIEQFPPVINLIRYVEKEYQGQLKLCVVTTESKRFGRFISPLSDISIRRFFFPGKESGRMKKLFDYILFNLKVLFQILKFRPDVVMYYETISVLPVYLAGFFLKRPLFIHYHEYISNDEYGRTDFQKSLHNIEKRLYDKAAWISHTNSYRLNLFKNDNHIFNEGNLYIMENFPPQSWFSEYRERNAGKSVKFVYVGSLSLENTYVIEFLNWVGSYKDASLDIFSQTEDAAILEYIESYDLSNVFVKGFIPYEDLPHVLKSYDIGIVWYKPYAENIIYCAPNKLFEYYSCGLEVWLPVGLEGARPYLKEDSWPRITEVDYKNPGILEKTYQSYGQGIYQHGPGYFCEQVYMKLVSKWLS